MSPVFAENPNVRGGGVKPVGPKSPTFTENLFLGLPLAHKMKHFYSSHYNNWMLLVPLLGIEHCDRRQGLEEQIIQFWTRRNIELSSQALVVIGVDIGKMPHT